MTVAAFEQKVIRILDANLNRATEGLRVAEEVARFILDNPELQKKIKQLRHDVLLLAGKTLAISVGSDSRFRAIIGSRDSVNDVGSKVITGPEKTRPDLSSIIQSNCSRAAESVRVFEEFSKLLSKRQTAGWKKLRFMIYSVEKELLSFTGREIIASKLRNMGLYCIIDKMYLGKRNPAAVAREMIAGGASVIQYRDKTSCDAEFLKACTKIRKVCADADVLFIVNDKTDTALLVNADGLHLGQDDMPVPEARKILGPGKIIGKSSHSCKEAIEAAKEDINYLAIGAMFPTETRDKSTVIGPKSIARIRKDLPQLPLVAIGGIDKKNISRVLAQKPDGICIVSAIQTAPDITKTVKDFIRIIRKGDR